VADLYQVATTALELARIRLRDATTLVEKKAVARASLDLYKAEFDQAQAVYDSAVYNLENTRIAAPANGIVSIVTLYEGEVVAAMKPVMNFFHSDDVKIASSLKQNGMEKLVPGMLQWFLGVYKFMNIWTLEGRGGAFVGWAIIHDYRNTHEFL
jgi:multidrug resistance efflux pump